MSGFFLYFPFLKKYFCAVSIFSAHFSMARVAQEWLQKTLCFVKRQRNDCL